MKSEKTVLETFRKIGEYELSTLRRDEPYCINSDISVVKYRVTVEVIKEDNSVYIERLQKLWDECGNHHHWRPLNEAAKKIGYEFPNSPGENKKAK